MRTAPLRVLPFLVLAALGLNLTGADASSDERLQNLQDSALRSQFLNPSPETRPGCYWYWLDSYVSKEGITKDLEAMSQVGIGRAYIGILGGSPGPKPKENFQPLSEPWWENIRHAIREGGRLGIKIGFFNSPGWSQSGGPWVKPEQAMRYVVSSETILNGTQKFSGQLVKPQGMIQEVAVLAYPKPQFDGMVIPEKERTSTSVTFASDQPVTVRSVTIKPGKSVDVTANLEVSEDGTSYRKVSKFAVNRSNLNVNVGPMPLAPVVVSLPPTAGKYFRITFSKACEVGDIRLSAAVRNGSVYEKQLAKLYQGANPEFDIYTWPAQAEPDAAGLTVAGKQVQVLSSHLKADGTFEWEVPPGEWVVQRLGMAMTGARNTPAPPEATGLEVDKMNREPLKAHFDAYVGKLLESMPSQERKVFKYVVADSYEQGSQNWTDGFKVIFQQRYGYDPIPWLPVLTGRVVESADQSDRFLWDLRRLVADRVATEYVGGLRDLSHVFEGIQNNEFNPNVAFKVGYMKALGKQVLLLKDNKVPLLPTDLLGKLYKDFDTYDPSGTIPNQMKGWMRDWEIIENRSIPIGLRNRVSGTLAFPIWRLGTRVREESISPSIGDCRTRSQPDNCAFGCRRDGARLSGLRGPRSAASKTRHYEVQLRNEQGTSAFSSVADCRTKPHAKCTRHPCWKGIPWSRRVVINK